MLIREVLQTGVFRVPKGGCQCRLFLAGSVNDRADYRQSNFRQICVAVPLYVLGSANLGLRPLSLLLFSSTQSNTIIIEIFLAIRVYFQYAMGSG